MDEATYLLSEILNQLKAMNERLEAILGTPTFSGYAGLSHISDQLNDVCRILESK